MSFVLFFFLSFVFQQHITNRSPATHHHSISFLHMFTTTTICEFVSFENRFASFRFFSPVVSQMNRLLKRAGDDGSTARKCSQSPTKRSSDFSFLQKEYRSSIELAKKFKQVKQEKIDKLHERLQGNTKAKVQEVVEVVEDDSTQEVEKTKKRTRGLITIGRMEEKKERVKVNQIQSSSQRNKEKLKNHEAMEGFAQVDGYANQEHQVVVTNKESEQGTSKKRKHGKATMDMLLENLQGNSSETHAQSFRNSRSIVQ